MVFKGFRNLVRLGKAFSAGGRDEYLYISSGVLLGLSILFTVAYMTNRLVGYAYVTIGRVTFRIDNPLGGVESVLILFSPFLAIASLAMLKVAVGFRTIPSILFAFLFIVPLFADPVLVLIPQIILVFLAIHALVGEREKLSLFGLGMLYSIAGLELAALVYDVTLLAGFRLKLLSNVVAFELYTWALLWPVTIIVISASVSLLMLRLVIRVLRGGSKASLAQASSSSRRYLLVSIVLATVIGVVGYTPTVNPLGVPLNVDWIHYYNALQRMLSSQNPVAEAFKAWQYSPGDRPLYMLTLYAIVKAFNVDVKALCMYHNIFLIQLYTLATYFMVKRIYGDEVAGIAALIAPATPGIASFVYGGFQANLFTLSVIYIAIGLVAEGKWISIPLVALISLIAILSHIYTWIHFASLFTAYLGLLTAILIAKLILRKSFDRKLAVKILAALAFIVVGIVLDVLVASRFGLLKKVNINYISQQALAGLRRVSTLSFGKVLNSLEFYSNIYTGGSLNNPLYWLLLVASSAFAPLAIESAIFVYISMALAVAAIAIDPLYTYRMLINTPTALVVAPLLARMGRWERALLLLSLYSVAVTKILTFVPGLKIP